MDRISQAYEKAKMLVGMEVEEESASPALDPGGTSFMDDFNRQCTLTTQQVSSPPPFFFMLSDLQRPFLRMIPLYRIEMNSIVGLF